MMPKRKRRVRGRKQSAHTLVSGFARVHFGDIYYSSVFDGKQVDDLAEEGEIPPIYKDVEPLCDEVRPELPQYPDGEDHEGYSTERERKALRCYSHYRSGEKSILGYDSTKQVNQFDVAAMLKEMQDIRCQLDNNQLTLHNMHASLIKQPKVSVHEVFHDSRQSLVEVNHQVEGQGIRAHDAVTLILDLLSQLFRLVLANFIAALANNTKTVDSDRSLRVSTVYPEQYTLTSFFNNSIYITSIRTCRRGLRHTLHLNFAASPRNWYSVLVEVKVESQARFHQALLPASCSTITSSHLKLPEAYADTLRKLLSILHLCKSRSQVYLSVSEDRSGKVFAAPNSISFSETCNDLLLAEEASIVHLVKSASCPVFVSSEVTTKAYVFRILFRAHVREQDLMEYKVPVSLTGSAPGELGLLDFYDEIRHLSELKDCHRVARILGVVLDDQRTSIRSYLYESLYVCSLISFLSWGYDEGFLVDWCIRENWAKQIAQAVDEVRRHGIIVGAIHVASVALREDGSVVLHSIHHRQRMREASAATHDLKKTKSENDEAVWELANARAVTDLGNTFYQLATHVRKEHCTCGRMGCLRTNSIQIPGHKILPSAGPPTPAYFREVVDRCRHAENCLKPTIEEVRNIFEENCKHEPDKTELLRFMRRFRGLEIERMGRLWTTCNWCGKAMFDKYYHCFVCNFGDFDLCLDCKARGCHCDDPEHKLSRRDQRNGKIIDLGFGSSWSSAYSST